MPKVTKIEANTPVARLKRVAAYARVSCSKEAMLHSLEAQVAVVIHETRTHDKKEYAKGALYLRLTTESIPSCSEYCRN